jgi:hypothetical protein
MIAATLAVLAVANVFGPNSASRPHDASEALERLGRATEFEDVQVGLDGHISASAEAYRLIDASPDAESLFAQLGREGGVVGQIYAAIGLRSRSPLAFEVVAERLRAQAAVRIPARMGCLREQLSVGELFDNRGPNTIRLERGQSVSAWLTEYGSGALDVMGGGYTALFRAP